MPRKSLLQPGDPPRFRRTYDGIEIHDRRGFVNVFARTESSNDWGQRWRRHYRLVSLYSQHFGQHHTTVEAALAYTTEAVAAAEAEFARAAADLAAHDRNPTVPKDCSDLVDGPDDWRSYLEHSREHVEKKLQRLRKWHHELEATQRLIARHEALGVPVERTAIPKRRAD